jgi:uncharacterized protein
MKIDPRVAAVAQKEAQGIFENVAGLLGVVIATPDGFDIASASNGRIAVPNMAALASSILAIGAAVSLETKLGASRNVSIVSDEGFAYLTAVNRPDGGLAIIVVAAHGAILAQVAHRCRECAAALEAV